MELFIFFQEWRIGGDCSKSYYHKNTFMKVLEYVESPYINNVVSYLWRPARGDER